MSEPTEYSMENKQPHPPLSELAQITQATKLLCSVMSTVHLYPSLAEKAEVIKLYHRAVEYVEQSISLSAFSEFARNYKRPEFSTDGPPDAISSTYRVALLLYYLSSRDLSSDELEQNDELREELHNALKETLDYVSPELRRDIERLDRLMILDCLVPHPTGDPDYNSEARAAFLLATYWHLYSFFILYLSTAYGWYTPDPMIPLRISLKLRIEECITRLKVDQSMSSVNDLLRMPIEDVDAIPEYISELVSRGSEAIESVSSEHGHFDFQFTPQEDVFIGSFNSTLEFCKKRTEREIGKHLKLAQDHNQENLSKPSKLQSLTPSDYVKRVELTLRSVIRRQYQERFGDKWINHLGKAIGQDAFDAAQATMRQRSVSDGTEILHFTTLPDLQRAIGENWTLFQDRFSLRKKELNTLLAPILKGRTEEAHNRPEHLYPEIEQQRLRVACDDLLNNILP